MKLILQNQVIEDGTVVDNGASHIVLYRDVNFEIIYFVRETVSGDVSSVAYVDSIVVTSDVQEWKNDENTCWLNNEPPQKVSPSLRNCHSTTDNSCCNWMHDEEIGGEYSSFIPEPC